MGVKILLFCQQKKKNKYFFYFTHPLLQNIYISLFILNIYSIKYSFFYNFLLFPSHSSLPSHRPNTTQNHQHSHHQWSIHTHHQPTQPPSSSNQPPSSTQPTTIIKPASTSTINPPNHHHQATSLQLKTQIQRNLKLAKSTQIHMESHSTQIPETPFNVNTYEILKLTDQTKNKKRIKTHQSKSQLIKQRIPKPHLSNKEKK